MPAATIVLSDCPAMFEQTFKNIDTILRNDGLESEIAYIEQTSWLLFLKYLDDLERDRSTESALHHKSYVRIIEEKYSWSSWAVPRGSDGKIDVNRVSTGADLVNFVNVELFPYLQGFKAKSENSDSVEYKIGEIFSEIRNRVQSGYNLREVIDLVAELEFGTQVQKHELSHLYESKIRNMGNAGRNGGEYYTPRPLIRAMLEVVNPKLGETICDPAVGSAGFLCEAFDYLKKNNPDRTTEQDQILQKRTLYGKEKKPLAFAIATLSLIHI